MSLRAVAFIVLFMLVVATSAYVSLHNQGTLLLPITLYGGYQIPVYAAIAWSFVIGLVLTSSLVLVRSGMRIWGRWKDSREARARERIERRYAQGLEALLGGSLERAEERFREVLAKQPEHAESLMSLGELLRGQGRAREAADLHRRAADLRPGDMRPLFALAADWKAEGNLDKAREALEMAIAANPSTSLKPRRELRDLLIGARRWEEAARVHEACEGLSREGPEKERTRRVGLGIRYEIARAEQSRGDLRGAERLYRAILKADPGFIPASLALGETLVAQGGVEEGLKVWRRGYETTQSPMFLARFEEHYLSREEPELIINLMRTLVDGARSRTIPAFYLARLYLRLEMIDEAEATFASIQGLATDTPLLQYYAAVILERRGRLKEAAAAYRGVVRASGLLKPRYSCQQCKSELGEVSARCPRCGDWSSVDVDVRDIVAAGDPGATPPTEWAAGA